ncbi:ELYS domain-containing protein [Cephalotus follicularis]|uniref:ELYS domain-containing protein n=1 Tax=Cephalotus follicularis TaxID=3775 RepID=A0A1Q3CCM9_CEPFO|nr:ELYS domain-containing protein [Cephalotus follicularis]
MERIGINGHYSPTTSADSGRIVRSAPPSVEPNYSSKALEEALGELASIDLIDLCNEAKVECCRATRDLRSCARTVDIMLSCGHASLCLECVQRCDFCPICRVPMPKDGNRYRYRLYNKLRAVGLVSKRYDERFHYNDNGDIRLTEAVQRLYSLFDVAMENNLISLICHYVTDVCMDESAVSSDPFISVLLDEVVVKDWCKRTFKKIIAELQGIYGLEVGEMRTRLSLLLKLSMQLTGVSNVLDVLESSFKGNLSAQLYDLQHLQESILKTKQHVDIMIWCIRHQFLENVRPRYPNFASWRSHVRERKSTAIKRAWSAPANHSAESNGQDGSLFIEDALANLDIEQGYPLEIGEESEVAVLRKDGGSSIFRARIEGVAGCYPFENLRAAVDVLFLHGSSDLVVAKQAIFLYYMFDRHWTMPDEQWRHIIDDFAATFNITRHSLLESLAFYLLDDHTDEALLEVCHLLPEICGPATHPKIAQVLLERQNPDAALMVLRWSGRDGGSQLVSLNEALTAIRVRVECGLLTEAFIYQRMLCNKIREKKLKGGPSEDNSENLKGECRTWTDWVETLVSEICCLCIWRNLVDQMIELPWNSDEEKYLHKTLLESAIYDSSTAIGNLLVVYYLQRYRYAEAYQVNLRLQSVEQGFISKNSISEEVLSKITSASHWRKSLVDKCVELLPEIQQQQVKIGKSPDIPVLSGNEVEMPAKSYFPEVQQPKLSSLLVSSSADSSLFLQMDHLSSPPKPSVSVGGSVSNQFELGNYRSSSVLHERLLANTGGPKREVGVRKNVRDDDVMTLRVRPVSPMNATPLKKVGRSSLRVLPNSQLEDKQSDKSLQEAEQNGFINEFQKTSPLYSHRVTADRSSPGSNLGLFKDSSQDLRSSMSNRRVQWDSNVGPETLVSSDVLMDISWTHREKLAVEDTNLNGGPRWRSDGSSDEEDQSLDRASGLSSYSNPRRGTRRNRFPRR